MILMIHDLTFQILCRWYKFMESNNNKKLVTLDSRVKQVGGTLIIKEAKVNRNGTITMHFIDIIIFQSG